MKINVVKLQFIEPLALMAERKDEFQNEVSTLASDTLKAALVSALASVDNEETVNAFNTQNIVSSAYPYFEQNGQTLYFFPKPMARLPINETKDPGHNKKLKKIQFFDQILFEKILNNKLIDLDKDAVLWQGGKFATAKSSVSNIALVSEKTKIYQAQTEQRVTIGNLNNFSHQEQGNPFYVSRTYFKHKFLPLNIQRQLSQYKFSQEEALKHTQNTGLFFIWEGDKELLDKALNILQYNGIGADKNVGNGKFTYTFDEIKIHTPESSGQTKYMILSKLIPAENEIENLLNNEATYNLTKRGGYIAGSSNEAFRHYLKPNIWTFDEGSVFAHVPKGENKDITGNLDEFVGHKVYRDGRPIVLPILPHTDKEKNNQ
ncbi:MAG: hypothetical protein Kow0079_17110 [Vicingaceae bacterium]